MRQTILSITTALLAHKNLPCMCLTFHVHERNHDSEKARFLHHEFEQMSLTLHSINRAIILGVVEAIFCQRNKENLE